MFLDRSRRRNNYKSSSSHNHCRLAPTDNLDYKSTSSNFPHHYSKACHHNHHNESCAD